MKYIYLHGFASAASSGKAQYFAQRFRELGMELIVPDLDGGDFEHLTITGQLEIVRRAAADEPVTLIGSSMGGYLAALYASLHPETVRLVMMAPAFYFPERWPQTIGEEKTAAWKQTRSLEVYHYAAGCNRVVDYGLIEDAVQYPAAPPFTQPALVFHGVHDDVVPAEYSDEFAAGRPHVKLRLLPSDHQLTDQVDLIWEESQSFLLS